MKNDQKQRIMEYAKQLNTTLAGDEQLLGFIVDEVADRIKLYLNADELDTRIERIAARVTVASYQQAAEAKNEATAAQGIKSISDNGQSITFSDGVKNYYANADDSAIMGGFTEVLKPYRRVRVAGT